MQYKGTSLQPCMRVLQSVCAHADQGGGVHGNAILSRYRLSDVGVVQHRYSANACHEGCQQRSRTSCMSLLSRGAMILEGLVAPTATLAEQFHVRDLQMHRVCCHQFWIRDAMMAAIVFSRHLIARHCTAGTIRWTGRTRRILWRSGSPGTEGAPCWPLPWMRRAAQSSCIACILRCPCPWCLPGDC